MPGVLVLVLIVPVVELRVNPAGAEKVPPVVKLAANTGVIDPEFWQTGLE